MKKFFKVLRITAIVIALLIAVLIIIPIAFRGKIDGIIKEEANKMLNAKLDYSKLGISLIRNFPNASLNLKDLSIVGIEEFENDTLVASKEISLVVNTLSIFKDSGIEVKKIILDKPCIFGHILANGKPNWDIMKADSTQVEETVSQEESNFKLHINKLAISDAKVRYLDEQGKMEFKTYPLNIQLKGDLDKDVTTLDLNLTAQKVLYILENQAYLNGQTLGVNGLIEADLANNKYSFTDTKLSLNAINLGINGNVLLADKYMDMDIKADCQKVNFKDILSLVPAIYTNDFKNLSVGGNLTMDAWAKGRMQGDTIPTFGVKMNLDNGNFKYAQLPKSVTDIFINLAVDNAGGSVDATKIDLSKLSMIMAGNKLDAALKLSTPISNPNFDAVMKGVIDFAHIKDVYPLPDSIKLSGIVTADFAVKGNMTQIEKEQYEQMNAKGTFNVKGFEATIGNMPKVFINNAQASITPKELIISEVIANIGKSDVKLSGGIQNYIGYVLKSTELKGNLNVVSNKLDLNEMFGLDDSSENISDDADETEESQQNLSDTSAIVIPKNLNLALNASLNEVLMNKIIIKNLIGKITVNDGVANLNNLSMNAFDGKLDVSGLYSSKDVTKPLANLNLSFKDASFKSTFEQLDMIKKIVPIFQKTGGNYSMNMNLSTALTSNLSPIMKSVNANGILTSSNINIQNVEVLSKLASVLKDEKLKNWQIKDAMIIKFTVKDGNVSTHPFDVKIGNVKMNLSGVTSLDKTIDYTAKITLPDNKFMSSANVKIGGTFASPKISLDAKDVATSVIKNVVGSKLPVNLDSLNVSKELQKKADELKAAANAAGDKLIAEAEKQKAALVEKAKGPVGKIAAEKAGDKLIEAAKKEKQKLLDKANEDANKLINKTK